MNNVIREHNNENEEDSEDDIGDLELASEFVEGEEDYDDDDEGFHFHKLKPMFSNTFKSIKRSILIETRHYRIKRDKLHHTTHNMNNNDTL